MTNLLDLKSGETGVVLNVLTDFDLKQRLRDIGFIKGTEVQFLHSSPTGDPRAYKLKSTIVALRNGDAKNIIITKQSDNYE